MALIKALLAGLTGVSLCLANISGKVTDTGGIPIAGATVYLEHFKDSATSQADGSFILGTTSSIKNQLTQTSLKPLASIQSGFLCVNIQEKSAVEINTYNLQGKLLSTIQKTVDAGSQSVALPQIGAGIYLYKVKLENTEFLLKSNSVGEVSRGIAAFSQNITGNKSLGKKTAIGSAISDVIAVIKTGYLNYRCVQYSSDTTGLKIKIIASAGTVTDTDGNVYQTVKIGNQIWTVENLRVTRFNDGTAISLDSSEATWDSLWYKSLTIPAYCYYNNMINTDSITKLGAFYNWYAVNTGKLAPKGWHVPTDSEWEVMQNYLVINGYNYDGTTDTTNNKIAIALAAQTDWVAGGSPWNNLTMDNSSGFSALPGGCRNSYGNFLFQSRIGFWWSSTEYDASSALFRSISIASDFLNHDYMGVIFDGEDASDESCGFSVRLVRD
jgi:uncharacterized protein (TIGR02145 family)